MTGPKNNPNAWSAGPRQKITPERQLWNLARTEERYNQAISRKEHLWVAAVAYFVTPPLGGEETFLDADSMASPPMLGCFICEEPYSEREMHRRCKGEAMEDAPWKH